MVQTAVSMIAQMCVIDSACYNMLWDIIFKAKYESSYNSTTDNSTTTMYNALEEHDLYIEDMVFAVYCWFVIIFGVTLNIFTILVLLFGDKNSPEMRVQLVNLAVADLAMSLVEPQTFRFHRLGLDVAMPMCSFGGFLQYATFTLSTLCNMAISIDRFIAVFFPLKVQDITYAHKVGAALVLWILTVAVDFGTVFNCKMWEIFDYEWCFCSAVVYDSSDISTGNLHLIRFLKYAIPAFVIVLMYTLIGIRIIEWKRFTPQIAVSSSKMRMRRKVRFITRKTVSCSLFLLLFTESERERQTELI